MLRWKVCFKLQMACYIFLGLFYVVWIFLQGLLGNYYLLGVLGERVEYERFGALRSGGKSKHKSWFYY